MRQKKDKRNEVVLMLYNKGFSHRQIGKIMGISFVASGYIVRRDNNNEVGNKYKSCVFCGSKERLLFDKKINICKKCAETLKRIV